MSADWNEYRLGDVTDWFSGGTPPKKKAEYWNGEIPWISASSMHSNHLGDSDLKISNAGLKAGSKLAEKGSILLLVRGSTLHQRIPVGITTRDVAFNQDVKSIKAKTEVVENLYLLFWFMANERELLSLVEDTGIGAGKLDTKLLQNLNIKIPPKIQRVKIIERLQLIDSKIDLNRSINSTLSQISQAIFKSWFVDFEPVKAKEHIRKLGGSRDQIEKAAQAIISGAVNLEDILKSSNLTDIDGTINSGLDEKFGSIAKEQQKELIETAELFQDRLVESELGLIPKGWECSNVKNILERLKPPKRYTKKQVQPYGKVPVFEQGAGLLLGFHNDLPGFEPNLKNPIFIFGDHTCLMHLSIRPFDISQNVIPIQGKTLPTIWVYYAVKDLQKFQEYRRHWSELIIKDVIVPPKPLCKLFEKVVTTNHQKIEQNNIQNKVLERIRDTLLPKLLSGELQVND